MLRKKTITFFFNFWRKKMIKEQQKCININQLFMNKLLMYRKQLPIDVLSLSVMNERKIDFVDDYFFTLLNIIFSISSLSVYVRI